MATEVAMLTTKLEAPTFLRRENLLAIYRQVITSVTYRYNTGRRILQHTPPGFSTRKSFDGW